MFNGKCSCTIGVFYFTYESLITSGLSNIARSLYIDLNVDIML